MHFLRSFSRAYKKRLVVISLLSVAASLSSVGAILLVTKRIARTDSWPGFLGVFFALGLSSLGASLLSHLLLIRLSNEVVHRLQLDLSRRILETPLARLEGLGPHRLLGMLTNDASALAAAVKNSVIVWKCAAAAAICFAYLASQSRGVFALVLATSIVAFWGYRAVRRRANPRFRDARMANDLFLKHVRGVVEGTKELKLHRGRREQHLSTSLPEAARAVERHAVVGESLLAWVFDVSRVVMLLLVGVVVFVWGRFEGVSRAQVASYALTILYMMSPLSELFSATQANARASASLEKLRELGASLERGGAEPTPRGESKTAPWRRLELRSVTHTYLQASEEGFKLGPIDLTIRPGELVFIVGGNGSGKSTLAKTLVGLYAPERGDIQLDDVPIVEDNREWYRQHFSAIFSDFFLFEDLRGLGVDTSELSAKAEEQLRELDLAGKSQIVEGAFTTTALSQGQRRRLALVAAYLEDRPIYVFDEWAAEQDPVFKKFFYMQLLAGMKARGKAIIVISHDERYFHLADQLIKLEHGKIVKEDTSAFMERLTGTSRVPASQA